MKVRASSTISHTSLRTQKINLLERFASGFARHWLFLVNVLIAIWVGLPWLAPVFMHWGWTSAGKAIYFLYSFQCHQLPERSFFLFGRETMYSLTEIQDVWQSTTDPSVLRQFIGNPEVGWKVAWSDRMVSMFTSILFAGLLYGPMRKKMKPITFWMLALLLLPMVIDGGTHMISDFAGIGQGFRDTNIWLQNLTYNAFPITFYHGDTLGSFNSWMRLVTGVLFGVGLVAFAFPYINNNFADIVGRSEPAHLRGLPNE